MKAKSDGVDFYQLNNGLSCYIIHKERKDNNISVCLSVKAGSAYEGQGEHGWFHFLEHLLIYPSLYQCAEKGNCEGKFLAFDYAYTSFYETAFWFHGTDESGNLLLDSIRTAKGILEGGYLTTEAFGCTKEDILREYNDYYCKSWFQECQLKLKEKKLSMPVGEYHDILGADYEKLVQKHKKYYRADKAALIINTVKDYSEVKSVLKELFETPTYLYLAWIPRKSMSDLILLKNYMEMSVVARAVEITFLKAKGIETAQCEVDIFNDKEYIFKLNISGEKICSYNTGSGNEDTAFTKALFNQAKGLVKKQLDDQYDERYMYCHGEEIMDSCREHFLYEEPILILENEYKVFCDCLQKCTYDDIKEKYDAVTAQFKRG